MFDLDVITEPAVAISALDPVRSQILSLLIEPGSASTVGLALGLPRQQINYHLRALEAHGLVRLVEERPKRGLTERVMQSTAMTYLISPTASGRQQLDPSRIDRLSSLYVIALAGRMVREVAELIGRAEQARKPLATLAIDTEIKFATAADRSAFAAELTETVTALAAKYHDEHASRGRWHRVVAVAHPFSRIDNNDSDTTEGTRR